jgi:hypothetical protein
MLVLEDEDIIKSAFGSNDFNALSFLDIKSLTLSSAKP